VPQSGQRPFHRACTAPHVRQLNTVLIFAMAAAAYTHPAHGPVSTHKLRPHTAPRANPAPLHKRHTMPA
jgi:hypothetical protein